MSKLLSNQVILTTALVLICLFNLTATMKNIKIKKRIDNYLSDSNHDQSKLREVLESGGMNGHFTSEEVFDIFLYLQKEHSQFISVKTIGQTVNGRNLLSFHLQKRSNKNEITKSKILFTGAHHARELLTVTIILKIFIESLHSLLHETKDSMFWILNDLVIVPLVNLDSHTLISESYNTINWDENRFKRKNMNMKYCG